MKMKLKQIGNSVGVILPKEELNRHGQRVSEQIDSEVNDDPFWDELKQFTKEERKAADKKDHLSDDDFKEWENL